jgi:hypothetical protein
MKNHENYDFHKTNENHEFHDFRGYCSNVEGISISLHLRDH